MTSADFRRELTQVMPGYKWVLHRARYAPTVQRATGTQSSGFNRLSTLQVVRTQGASGTSYQVKSAGYGAKAPWEGAATNTSLRRALRDLQKFYEDEASKYGRLAAAMEKGRYAQEGAA